MAPGHRSGDKSCRDQHTGIVIKPERSIVLIGFMGTGKSSVGRRLAVALGCPRFDTDQMVTVNLGRPIARIFAELGEERFRTEESAVLQSIDAHQPAVIVTGGGIVLRPPNIARLRELGTVICLTAALPILQKRLARRADRPLLQTPDPAETVRELLRVREPAYAAAANFTIDTSTLTHDEVSQTIQDSLALAG